MLVGMIVVGLGYQTVVAQAQATLQMAKLYQPAIAALAKAPIKQHWQAVGVAGGAIWPGLRTLWLMLLPLASCVAIYLESTRGKALAELRADKERQAQGRD